MLQGFLKTRHIDQVYWSLGVELVFYVIMGGLFFLKQLKNINYICLIWLLVVSISLLFNFPGEKYLRVLAITDSAPLFIAGIMFYKIKYEKSSYLNVFIIALCLILYLISFNFQLILRNHVDVDAAHFILVIFAFIGFFILVNVNIKILRNKFLLFLGSVSYPLYLLHNVIAYSIIYRLKMVIDNQFFYVFITMIIMITMAYIVTVLIDKPSKAMNKKLNLYFTNTLQSKVNI